MAVNLDIDKKAAIFRKLASGTLYEVGVEFELDKHYKDAVAVRNKVYNIYREVSQDPETYFVHPDTVALVVEAVSKRKVATRTADTMVETQEKLKNADIKSLTISSRDKAGKLINHKLTYLESHPKALVGESLVTLGKIFGILFDKAQIITGQATEHVAVLSKLDPNMTSEEAIQAVLRSREINQVEKYG